MRHGRLTPMTDPLAELRVVRDGDSVRCAVDGEIDLSNVEEVERGIRMAVGDARSVIVDLAACTYLDSQGVRLLHLLASDLKAEGASLVVVAPEGSFARDVVTITDLGTSAEIRAE